MLVMSTLFQNIQRITMNDPTHSTDPDAVSTTSFDEGGALIDRSSGVICPGCRHEELVIGELEGCQFAGCPGCEGMLFQQSVFAMLIGHLRAESRLPTLAPVPLDVEELRVERYCPTCDGRLETHAYGGPGNAVIDTCFPCGVIWFDQGELTKLVRAPGRR